MADQEEGCAAPSWMAPAAAAREISFRVLNTLCNAMAAREFDENEAEVLIDSVLSGKNYKGAGWWVDGLYSNGVCSSVLLGGPVPQSIRAVIEFRGIDITQINPRRYMGPIHQRRKKKLWWSPRAGEVGWAEVLPYDSSCGVWRLHVCHYQAELSARIAYDLGLLPKPKWDGSIYDRHATHWPHRGDKIEFSFLPKEFTPMMAKWVVELIFSAERPKRGEFDHSPEKWLDDNLQPFLAPQRTQDPSYMWTLEASAVQDQRDLQRLQRQQHSERLEQRRRT